MEENKQKTPMQDTTKDDSSDVEKVRQGSQSPPPQPQKDQQNTGNRSIQEEEAEKGHA